MAMGNQTNVKDRLSPCYVTKIDAISIDILEITIKNTYMVKQADAFLFFHKKRTKIQYVS